MLLKSLFPFRMRSEGLLTVTAFKEGQTSCFTFRSRILVCTEISQEGWKSDPHDLMLNLRLMTSVSRNHEELAKRVMSRNIT